MNNYSLDLLDCVMLLVVQYFREVLLIIAVLRLKKSGIYVIIDCRIIRRFCFGGFSRRDVTLFFGNLCSIARKNVYIAEENVPRPVWDCFFTSDLPMKRRRPFVRDGKRR